MPAYVTRPSITLAGHRVTTAEVAADIQAHHSEHPRLAAILRVVQGCGVDTRYFSRPLAEVAADGGGEARNADAFADATAMGIVAAQRALDEAGLTADDIDFIVTSHTTSWAVPQLDVHLIGALGLRPTVSRIPMATLACAGGVQALVAASRYVQARPGSRGLVVVAEKLSTIYQHADTTIESMIYKALFGDSAGACVVSGDPIGPGLAIEETFEYVLPDSLDRYWGRLDERGLHFDSTKKAARAAQDVIPAVQQWLGEWRPSWAAIHPGGTRIISDVAEGVDLDDKDAHHSFASLRENGNLGGVAALDVLRRTHAAPPPDGAEGLALAVGPGFTASAVRGHWRALAA